MDLLVSRGKNIFCVKRPAKDIIELRLASVGVESIDNFEPGVIANRDTIRTVAQYLTYCNSALNSGIDTRFTTIALVKLIEMHMAITLESMIRRV